MGLIWENLGVSCKKAGLQKSCYLVNNSKIESTKCKAINLSLDYFDDYNSIENFEGSLYQYFDFEENNLNLNFGFQEEKKEEKVKIKSNFFKSLKRNLMKNCCCDKFN
jgi:hypothetical protein